MAKLTLPVNRKDHTSGLPGAAITFVEYGDFQCGHCGAAYPGVKQLKREFPKTLLFAFRHFPLTNAHPFAAPAAIAAEAAGRQHKFWEMHDVLFERQHLLGSMPFTDFALVIGLDLSRFKSDVLDPALAEKVEADFESGMRSGVNGTPSFFINGEKHNGGYDYQTLLWAIEEHASPVP